MGRLASLSIATKVAVTARPTNTRITFTKLDSLGI